VTESSERLWTSGLTAPRFPVCEVVAAAQTLGQFVNEGVRRPGGRGGRRGWCRPRFCCAGSRSRGCCCSSSTRRRSGSVHGGRRHRGRRRRTGSWSCASRSHRVCRLGGDGFDDVADRLPAEEDAVGAGPAQGNSGSDGCSGRSQVRAQVGDGGDRMARRVLGQTSTGCRLGPPRRVVRSTSESSGPCGRCTLARSRLASCPGPRPVMPRPLRRVLGLGDDLLGQLAVPTGTPRSPATSGVRAARR
jgi:hypothetical protein